MEEPPRILTIRHGSRHAAPGGGKKREYHFKQKLGAGVNGVAAEYEDQSNHKSVAIKFSKAHAAPAERNAFAVSQRINPKLSYLHNLSPAYELLELPAEAGVKSGVATIWGWGGERTVWDAMQKPDWTPDNADTALACILRALLKLHQEGHLHGDLHAENVMVHQTRKKGITVNLIDFGNCLKIEGGWTKWPYAVKDENKDKGPAYGSTQFPPELV
jgi:serine/threonine protein kinase